VARGAKRWEGGARDGQRAAVYAWEDRVVAPHDPSFVTFEAAQGFVDAVWAEAGLSYPPKVEALPKRARATLADANRLRIRLPPRIPSWCLLHEIAHAMTSTMDGASDGHGARFAGVYIGLLAKYLRRDARDLAASAARAGVEVDLAARPAFVDG
jgi:hypothetical protein